MKNTTTNCRRCSECRGASHHWILNGDFGNEDEPEEIQEADYVCKHCDQLGRECPACYGDGTEGASDDICDNCNGEGVIAMATKAIPKEGI